MAPAVKPIPEGYHNLTPYLIVKGATEALAFYTKALGAVELMRIPGTDGRIGHAEMRIGDSRIMLADEYPEMNARSPHSIGGTPVSLHLYVEDVDAVADRAVKAGAKLLRPVADQFYGDRMGSLVDPFGHHWHVSTHMEDVAPEELKRRAEQAAKQHKSG